MNSFVIVVLALVAAAQANAVYRRLQVEDRVVGGEEAVPNSYPYQAFMRMTAANGQIYQCGGSLLTPTTVLTAAHCVKGYISISVYLGAHNIREEEATQQRKQAVSFEYHEDYNPLRITNDIAIVTLDSPVEINQYVQLTRLPTRADVGNTYVGELATVSGWGIYSDAIGRPSDVLRFVSSPVVSNADCSKDYGNIVPTKICISGKAMKSSCGGDSGGPLVIGDDRVQIGLVSYGKRAGCEKGYHAVFTRITDYLDWIADKGGVLIN